MESGFLWLERQPQCYAGKQPISRGATNRWEASLQFYEAKLCFAFKVHAFMLSTVTQSMWNRVEIFVFFSSETEHENPILIPTLRATL